MIDLFVDTFSGKFSIKRDLIKTISWRIIGSLDTIVLGSIITGKLSFGLKIGFAEIITKMLLYFFHERIWHKITIGLPTRNSIALQTKADLHAQLFLQNSKIDRNAREQLNNHKAFTIWLTGLSASGKSSIASSLDEILFTQKIHAFVIDGDNTRLGINSDLNFSAEDRQENIRRVAEICKLMNDAGTIVIAAFISPFEKDRIAASKIIGTDKFILTHLNASVDTCKKRDKKGLYQLAAQGKIKDFTGVNSPYEAPSQPNLVLNTEVLSIEQSVATIIQYLKDKRWLQFPG